MEERKIGRELLEATDELGKKVVALTVNDTLYDLHTPIAVPVGATLKPVFAGAPEALKIIRHSTAHVMADAVQRLSRYGTDYKTCLQERLQALHGKLPEYQLTKVSGPDHARIFSMEVRFDGTLLGRGCGPSKKRAEQQAAAMSLDHSLVRKSENN